MILNCQYRIDQEEKRTTHLGKQAKNEGVEGRQIIEYAISMFEFKVIER